jgi:hypothetical protein
MESYLVTCRNDCGKLSCKLRTFIRIGNPGRRNVTRCLALSCEFRTSRGPLVTDRRILPTRCPNAR